jgi:hypothetical protein
MPNYSLNTGLPEKSRTLEDKGFHGVSITTTTPATTYRYPNDSISAPLEKPHTLTNEVNPSSDITTREIGETAGDITKRNANG